MDITSFLIGKEVGGGSAPTPTYQDKEITITQNGEQTITADSGYDALSSVEITTNVPAGVNLNDYMPSTYNYYDANVRLAGVIKKLPDDFSFNSVNTMLSYFFQYNNLEELPEELDVSFSNYFYAFLNNSQKLTEIDLTKWTFPSSISTTEHFITECPELIKINMSNFNSSLNWSESMFQANPKLEEVDISSLNNSNSYPRVNNWFFGDISMKKIDISSFNFTRINGTLTSMFGTDATEGVPDNCLILVKDQTQKDTIETAVPRLTNVQIKGA